MILKIHVPDAPSYDVGPEIWHQPLAEVIREQAQVVAEGAGPRLLGPADRLQHAALRVQTIVEMTSALQRVGDKYRAADGVLYSLCEEPALEVCPGAGRLDKVSSPKPPIVEEVLRFEHLPLGSSSSRRAIVRWSGGSDGEALRWFADEILICEGDLVGKTCSTPRVSSTPKRAATSRVSGAER